MTRPIPLEDLDVVENGLPEPAPVHFPHFAFDLAVVAALICLAIFI